MAAMHFEFVSPENVLFSGEVDQVDLPGAEGDMGILAGHAPLVTTLAARHRDDLPRRRARPVVVIGGFAEVSPAGLTVLADRAVPREDFDMARARRRDQGCRGRRRRCRSDARRARHRADCARRTRLDQLKMRLQAALAQ